MGGGAGDQAVVGLADGYRPRKRPLVSATVLVSLWMLSSLMLMLRVVVHMPIHSACTGGVYVRKTLLS